MCTSNKLFKKKYELFNSLGKYVGFYLAYFSINTKTNLDYAAFLKASLLIYVVIIGGFFLTYYLAL